MIGLILSHQLLVCLYRADVPANIVSPIIGLLLSFIHQPLIFLSFIHQPLIFNIAALVGPSFIDQSLLSQC